MMRAVLLLLLALLASVALTLLFYEDNGYVLVSFGVWSVETSLVVFALALLLALGLGALLWTMLRGTWRVPGRWLAGWRRYRQDSARRALVEALLAFARGEWRRAEQQLTQHAGGSGDDVTLHYLCAANAAQRRGRRDRRDAWLRQAYESADSDRTRQAVLLTQAQLQMRSQQYEQAVATLSSLRESARESVSLLELQWRAWRELRDWENLRHLLPRLRRRGVSSPERLDGLAIEVYSELMRAAAARADSDKVAALYAELPRRLRRDTRLLLCYVDCLAATGADQAAAELLRKQLRREWDEALALRYSKLAGPDPAAQLAVAQRWLDQYGEQPTALLVVGRLCVRNRLWGKARHYLELAVRRGNQPEACLELGQLLERMGEHEAAGKVFATGLETTLNAAPREK